MADIVSCTAPIRGWGATGTYTLAIVVEEGLEFYNVWVSDYAHDLQLAVLIEVSLSHSVQPRLLHELTHLEALVLEHPLDGRIFAAGRQFSLEDNTERAVADDFALCVRQVFVLARLTVLHLLADDLCGNVSVVASAETWRDPYHPFSAMRRPMAGSGSLSGGIRCRGGPPSARIAIESRAGWS